MRIDKPWLDYLPTIIFVSDMGDSLGASTPFEYLHREVVEVASTSPGLRHIWLWFTKQPRRCLEFARWLDEHGVKWPDNLVPVVSVTSRKTTSRISLLRDMPSRWRGISAEPLWEEISPGLDGIHWCVTGGQSGHYRNHPLDLGWARTLRNCCHDFGTAFFLKQLGNHPIENGRNVALRDATGGDWGEFPPDLRVREMPKQFHQWGFEQWERARTSAV